MSRLSLAFVRVAVVLLPVTVQARFLDEWRAEAEVVRQQSGELAALGFAIRLVLACLLYTSPSPRDKRQSRMPSSA